MEKQYRVALVVEDHPMLQKTLCDILGSQYDEVIGVTNAAEAKQHAHNYSKELTLVVIDFFIEPVSGHGTSTLRNPLGLVLAHELRKKLPNLPIVMMSGERDNEYIRRHINEANMSYEVSFSFIHKSLITDSRQFIELCDETTRGITTSKYPTSRYQESIESVIKQIMWSEDFAEVDWNTAVNLWNGLSETKKEVTQCIANGFSRDEIAQCCNLAKATVNTYVSQIAETLEIPESVNRDVWIARFMLCKDLLDATQL